MNFESNTSGLSVTLYWNIEEFLFNESGYMLVVMSTVFPFENEIVFGRVSSSPRSFLGVAHNISSSA